MANQQNVVVLHHGTLARKNAAAFMGMEPEIHDLCRVVDLTLHTFLDELKEPIADDGSSCVQVLLEDLQQRARKLRSRYSSDDRNHDPAALRAAMKIGLAACLLLATTVVAGAWESTGTTTTNNVPPALTGVYPNRPWILVSVSDPWPADFPLSAQPLLHTPLPNCERAGIRHRASPNETARRGLTLVQ